MPGVTPLPGTEHHPHARAVLEAARPPHGRASHAYLFHGPGGVGKGAAAEALAAELLAEGAPDPENARARVVSRAHPDLTWITPSGARELLVEDVEPVLSGAARTPFESTRRVFVIERAETMNDSSANRLLKTLEEPPAFVHIMLLTDRPAELLPTIVSRCQAVRFDPLPDDALARALGEEGVPPDNAAAAARLALGDGARARLLAGPAGTELRGAAEGFARAAFSGAMRQKPWSVLLTTAVERGKAAVATVDEEFKEREDLFARSERSKARRDHETRSKRLDRRERTETLDLGLALVGLWYRDAAAIAWGAEDLVCHVDRVAELHADAQGADVTRLRDAVELVEDARRRLVLNVGEELTCEALGYRLEALLAR